MLFSYFHTQIKCLPLLSVNIRYAVNIYSLLDKTSGSTWAKRACHSETREYAKNC